MTYEIKYPNQKTYWIFWTDKVSNFAYGSTETSQVTDTNQPNWYTTFIEGIYAPRCFDHQRYW